MIPKRLVQPKGKTVWNCTGSVPCRTWCSVHFLSTSCPEVAKNYHRHGRHPKYVKKHKVKNHGKNKTFATNEFNKSFSLNVQKTFLHLYYTPVQSIMSCLQAPNPLHNAVGHKAILWRWLLQWRQVTGSTAHEAFLTPINWRQSRDWKGRSTTVFSNLLLVPTSKSTMSTTIDMLVLHHMPLYRRSSKIDCAKRGPMQNRILHAYIHWYYLQAYL